MREIGDSSKILRMKRLPLYVLALGDRAPHPDRSSDSIIDEIKSVTE